MSDFARKEHEEKEKESLPHGDESDEEEASLQIAWLSTPRPSILTRRPRVSWPTSQGRSMLTRVKRHTNLVGLDSTWHTFSWMFDKRFSLKSAPYARRALIPYITCIANSLAKFDFLIWSGDVLVMLPSFSSRDLLQILVFSTFSHPVPL